MAATFLQELAGEGPIWTQVALVAAHQDDETIAAAGTMARFLNLTLIHVTNGAALDGQAFRAAGFATRSDYAKARHAELGAALQAACVRPVRQVCYEVADGEVGNQLAAVTQWLSADLMSVQAVLTHPYEGGHADHDACARAVHGAALAIREKTTRTLELVEFASYYHRHGEVRGGRFWPDAHCPELHKRLAGSALRRRAAAFACYQSQAGNLRFFSLDDERFRQAPVYDFGRPPPPVRTSGQQ